MDWLLRVVDPFKSFRSLAAQIAVSKGKWKYRKRMRRDNSQWKPAEFIAVLLHRGIPFDAAFAALEIGKGG